MSEHTITTIIEGNVLSALLFFEGIRVNINGGSGMFQSTNTIAVTGPLNVTVVVSGIAPAAWKLTIKEGGNTLVDHPDTIGPGNIGTFSTEVFLAGGEVGAVAAASGKKAAKKSGKKGGGKSGGKVGRKGSR